MCLLIIYQVVNAMRYIGLDYDIQAIDITDPNPIALMMLSVYIYQKLPLYLPKSTVTFVGSLHQAVQRQVWLIRMVLVWNVIFFSHRTLIVNIFANLRSAALLEADIVLTTIWIFYNPDYYVCKWSNELSSFCTRVHSLTFDDWWLCSGHLRCTTEFIDHSVHWFYSTQSIFRTTTP